MWLCLVTNLTCFYSSEPKHIHYPFLVIRQDLTHTTGAIPAWMKQLSMACFCIPPSSLLLPRCLNKCEYILPPLSEDILSFLSFIVAATNSSSDDPLTSSAAESISRSMMPVICNGTSANSLLGRWRLCVEMFGQAFLEDVGSEPCSVSVSYTHLTLPTSDLV